MIVKLSRFVGLVLCAILAFGGAILLIGGFMLIESGGSPYYAASGTVLIVSAWFVVRRDALGVILYGLLTLFSTLWALWEVGLDGWALMPRLGAFFVILAAMTLAVPGLAPMGQRRRRTVWLALGVPAAAMMLAGGGACFHSRFPAQGPSDLAREAFEVAGAPAQSEDSASRDASAHFSPASQITPVNAGRLITAWSYHTGDLLGPTEHGGFEARPVVVGDRLYFCTPHSKVIALDAASGREVWKYDPHVILAPDSFTICRGITFYRLDSADPGGRCKERIALGTRDFRLISLDAQDGKPCRTFGRNGEVRLARGFPRIPPGALTMTSPPAFIDGVLVVGHMVMDNQRTDALPGVVRAYDARSGQFRWAWDIGRPGVTGEPPDGKTYSLGRPNAWAGFTPDPQEHLVFVPTGNPGADYASATRSADMLKYGSSLVALDAGSGQPRWSFQTVHRDTWDYDLSSPPALIDFPTASGLVPAVAQATKSAQIFILRRKDGVPLVPVSERPVSRQAAPGEPKAKTQPFSAMPDIGGRDLTEADAWGITPIDEMICRIEFRRSHYAGRFTAVVTKPTIYFPGYVGGMDWGGIAIDPLRDILVANVSRVANRAWLIPHKGPVRAQGDPGQDHPVFFPYPQKGTAYSVISFPWLSPLGIPCQRPPWGVMAGINLRTQKIVWERAIGDASQSGPLGLRSHLPLTVGTPNQGGALVTAGGVTFIGATVDAKFRAFNTMTGKLLWEHRLPGGGQAIPASYMAGDKQYVVIAAGGHNVLGSPVSDEIVAFRLPDPAR